MILNPETNGHAGRRMVNRSFTSPIGMATGKFILLTLMAQTGVACPTTHSTIFGQTGHPMGVTSRIALIGMTVGKSTCLNCGLGSREP